MSKQRSLRTEWERVAGVSVVVVGVVLVVVGYLGVSDARYAVEEISYLISGGIAGLLALGIGITLFISSDRRHELERLDRLEAALRSVAGPPAVEADLRTGLSPVIKGRIKV